MEYLKLPDRYNIAENGISAIEDRLTLTFYKEGRSFETVKKAFSNITNPVIYSCIVQKDGRETDEWISCYFDKYTSLRSISYDIDNDVYSVLLTIPDEVEVRLTALENAKPALTSPFTTNAEPLGKASFYYEKGDLVAIYNENCEPITVEVTEPISVNQSIIIGLNCEQYLGGK